MNDLSKFSSNKNSSILHYSKVEEDVLKFSFSRWVTKLDEIEVNWNWGQLDPNWQPLNIDLFEDLWIDRKRGLGEILVKATTKWWSSSTYSMCFSRLSKFSGKCWQVLHNCTIAWTSSFHLLKSFTYIFLIWEKIYCKTKSKKLRAKIFIVFSINFFVWFYLMSAQLLVRRQADVTND